MSDERRAVDWHLYDTGPEIYGYEETSVRLHGGLIYLFLSLDSNGSAAMTIVQRFF
jgi:hypothetical protein